MKSSIGILFAIIAFFNASCNMEIMKDRLEKNDQINYPYIASEKRKTSILEGYRKVKIGMNVDEVLGILSSPDEVNDTFDINNRSIRIGYSFVYLISRKQKNGSVNEKGEHLIRVMFNLNHEVIRMDKW